MGWRSWNCYHQAISQEKMTAAANAMVNKSRGLSLLEVGYENCGLDDYYQACRTGVQGSFHNASGYPLIDKTKFPNMKAMTDHAHSIGLKMGWCTLKPSQLCIATNLAVRDLQLVDPVCRCEQLWLQ